MTALDVTLYVLSALAGLAFGSFLNVCIYRLPRGEFFSKSRSFCPRCKAPIKARDNIPVLSYVLLRGKCRNCGERISPRYPFVELLTCALWVGNYAAFGLSGLTLVYDVAVAVLIVAAFVDIDTCEIPDSGIITLLILGAITFAPFGGVSWQDKLIGCVCVSVPMLVICLLGGMGFGDVKLYFVLGLLLGWKKILVVFILSVVTGAVVSVAYMIVTRNKEVVIPVEEYDDVYVRQSRQSALPSDGAECGSDGAVSEARGGEADVRSEAGEEGTKRAKARRRMHTIPFGPFIAFATVVTLYVGDAVISLYARLLGV